MNETMMVNAFSMEELDATNRVVLQYGKWCKTFYYSDELPRWIPVSERLPDISESVLICDIDGDICIGHHTRLGDYYPDFCDDKIESVAAWMPMPEPYSQDAIEAVSEECRGTFARCEEKLQALPSTQPRMKGRWTTGLNENGVTTSLFCSKCNYENKHWYEWNFCPNCGCDMRREVQE